MNYRYVIEDFEKVVRLSPFESRNALISYSDIRDLGLNMTEDIDSRNFVLLRKKGFY